MDIDGEPEAAVEDMVVYDQRRSSKRAPSTTLRDTFVGLIEGIKSRLVAGRSTDDEAIRAIVQCLAGKAFVRSDSEERNARQAGRAVKEAPSQQEKLTLFNNLCHRFLNLDFS